MSFMPPPSRGLGGPPPEALVDEKEIKRLKARDGEENRRVARWILHTAKPYLPGIAGLMATSICSSALGIVFALLSQKTVNGAVDQDMHALVIFAVLLGCTGLAQVILRALNAYLTERVSARVENGYRSRLFNYILDRDYQQISAFHSGDLMNRMTDDVNVIVSGVTSFLPSVAEIIANLVGAGGVLLVMDWRFSLIYVLATVVIIVVNKVWRRAIKQLTKEMRASDGDVRSYYQDAIGSLLVLRVFVTEGRAKETSTKLLQNFYTKRMQRNKVRIKSNAAVGFSMNFGHVFALIWGSFQLTRGAMSYGTLVAIMQLTSQVRQPFISASNLATQYYTMIASGERLMAIEALDPELTAEERSRMEAAGDARELYPGMERIVVDSVSFGYGMGEVLSGIDAVIEKGDTMAIMGQSGCGKSTLFKLMLGMYRDHEGSLELQGTGENGEAWSQPLGPQTRRLFAYVPQGNLLVSGRLRDNIAFSDREVSDKEIWEACRIACADDFLRRLPQGLDTVVGEHGSGLSEGQNQRIAVARALLSGAPILLLDEATSALDDETEARMLRNIQQLQDRTCLIVTHRKAALDICNKSLVLQDGVLSAAAEPVPAVSGAGGPREYSEYERPKGMSRPVRRR